VEHLINEHIKIHIFNHPGNLPHQAENGDTEPKTAGQFGFHFEASFLYQYNKPPVKRQESVAFSEIEE
jgi:hypothetical protein